MPAPRGIATTIAHPPITMTRSPNPPRLTKNQTLQRLRDLDLEHGPLTFDWLDKHHPAVVVGAFRHFESVPAARKAAGVPDPKPSSKWSVERIVNELRAEHRAGVRMTVRSLNDAGRGALVSAVRQLIGGLPRARRLARIPRPPTLLIDLEPWGSWDEERVTAEIRASYAAGEPLNAANAPSKLRSAGVRLFGSWQAAIEVAGLDYDKIRVLRRAYSKTDICEELRRLRRSCPDMTRGDLYSQPFSPALAQLFGSLESALSAANIHGWPVWRRHPKWTRKQVIAALHADRGGPGMDRRLGDIARVYFGSMHAARKAAKLPSLRRAWSRKAVVAELRAMARKDEFAPDRNLSAACERYFGGVVAARRAAGLTLPEKMWSPEKLIDVILEHARKRNVRLPLPVVDACCNHFGSVTAARKAANLEREISTWPKHAVLAALSVSFQDTYLLNALLDRVAKLLGLDPRDLLDENEVAARVGITRSSILSRRLRGRGGLPHLRLGRLIRYRRQDVDAFIASRKNRDAALIERKGRATPGR